MLQPSRHHLIFYQNASFRQQFIIDPGPILTGATFEATLQINSSSSQGYCTPPDPVDPIPFVVDFNSTTRTVTLSLPSTTVAQLTPNCSYTLLDRLVVDEEGNMDITLLQGFDFSKLPTQYRFILYWLHDGDKDPLTYGSVLVVGD